MLFADRYYNGYYWRYTISGITDYHNDDYQVLEEEMRNNGIIHELELRRPYDQCFVYFTPQNKDNVEELLYDQCDITCERYYHSRFYHFKDEKWCERFLDILELPHTYHEDGYMSIHHTRKREGIQFEALKQVRSEMLEQEKQNNG